MSNASATPKGKQITNYLSAERITRAVASFFQAMGDATLSEFTLKTGRRVDLIALSRRQHITIVEAKSFLTDFSSDKKWQNYLDWADQFYFAVAENFPVESLADEKRCGILITDGFDKHILREAPLCKLPT